MLALDYMGCLWCLNGMWSWYLLDVGVGCHVVLMMHAHVFIDACVLGLDGIVKFGGVYYIIFV